MKKTVAVILVLVVTGINACKHDTLIPGGEPPPGITPPPAGAPVICFQTDVLPIFVSNCAKAGCHNAITQANGLRYDNYDDIMKTIKPNRPSNSEAWELITSDRPDKVMPPPPTPRLSKAQKDSIYKWIVQGAPNTVNCNTVCDTGFFVFNAAIRPILLSACTGCHSGVAPSGNYDFTNFNTLQSVALNGKLLGAITHDPNYPPMPKGGNKLPDCKITQIRKWVEAGAPNN